MRLVLISDTHGQHGNLAIPKGDVIIHCGDFTSYMGDVMEANQFFTWYLSLPHKYKILIAGNHDECMENKSATVPEGIIYLENSGVEIEGKYFWGSPYTPKFGNWSFMADRGSQKLRDIWESIPTGTDVLITHGPPHTILDRTITDKFAGCEILLERLLAENENLPRINPKLHCFGHIHESAGKYIFDDVTYINAAVVDYKWRLNVNPQVFDL